MESDINGIAENCQFCKILNGTEIASFVYQDDRCAVFLDIRPVNPGHLLVVPTQHAARLSELDPENGAYLFQIAQRAATALYSSGLKTEGIDLLLADGKAAGQTVAHMHIHVLPRFQGDGFGFKYRFSKIIKPSRLLLDQNAAKIRQAWIPGRMNTDNFK